MAEGGDAMKRWQDIIDRLKEDGDWEAAAALWDARDTIDKMLAAIRAAEQDARGAEGGQRGGRRIRRQQRRRGERSHRDGPSRPAGAVEVTTERQR